MADVVAPRDLAQWLAVTVATTNRFALLMVSVSFGLRPSLTPRAIARSRPSAVRARINPFSNSASPPSIVSINRPHGVVVSAHVSAKERKPDLRSAIAARVFNRSRVDHAA